jgi:hypothetical protein
MMRHTLTRKTDREGYQVGYYDPAAARWELIAEVDTLEQAAALTSYLNGGDRPVRAINPK